jgi:hypothetical protein
VFTAGINEKKEDKCSRSATWAGPERREVKADEASWDESESAKHVRELKIEGEIVCEGEADWPRLFCEGPPKELMTSALWLAHVDERVDGGKAAMTTH